MSSGNGKANGVANGTSGKAAPASSRVPRTEYRKDPARYLEQARTAGPVTIIDASGQPRIMIVAPQRVVDFDDA